MFAQLRTLSLIPPGCFQRDVKTCLRKAAAGNHSDLCALLLSRYSHLLGDDAPDIGLHEAVLEGHLKTVQWLVHCGASLKWPDKV
jgi:hypothetical protein